MSDNKYTLVIYSQDGCPEIGGDTSVYFSNYDGHKELFYLVVIR